MIRISFTGDILCYKSQNNGCRNENGTYDYTPIFEQIQPLLEKSDYVVGSFETTCAGKDSGYTLTDSSFNTPDEFLLALKKAGFDMLTTANNHCLDRGEIGLLRTIKKIKEYGLEYTGTRSDINDPRYLLKVFGDTKVAFVAYTYGTNSESNGHMLAKEKEFMVNLTRPQDVPYLRPFWKKVLLRLIPKFMLPHRSLGVVGDCVSASEINNESNIAYEHAMIETIKDAKQNSDIVITCLHSGGQFNSKVGSYTSHLFDLIADAGADVIVCNHAHTILPIYKKRKSFIASALGNLSCAPGEGYWVDGVKAEYSTILTFEIEDKRIKDYSVSVCKSLYNEKGLAITVPVNNNQELNDILYHKLNDLSL